MRSFLHPVTDSSLCDVHATVLRTCRSSHAGDARTRLVFKKSGGVVHPSVSMIISRIDNLLAMNIRQVNVF